ncbi:MAG: hypothetical protein HYT79_11870 [Elusimicrobia bacterium]|nr:hypothetical protein [Elusimicrobiota bacterium]
MRGLIVLLFLFIARPLPAQIKYIPVAEAKLLGGQSFFEQKDTSVDGNFSFRFTPSIAFSDKSTLIPTLSSDYRTIFTVEELAGGGFLIQKIWENLATVKWVRQLGEGPYSIKPKASGKLAYYNEAKGETFGTGLFDYEKFSGGVELERKGQRLLSQRLELAYYTVRFPNYQALSSQQFGAEIKSGTRVLDFDAMDASYSLDVAVAEKTIAYGAFLISARPYPDQFIVKDTGLFETTKRKDAYWLAAAGCHQGLGEYDWGGVALKPIASLAASYSMLDSNQNSYDAVKTFFINNYYDYDELALSPSMTFLFDKNQRLNLGYTGIVRRYDTRLVQDKDGNYHDGTSGRPNEIIAATTHNVNLGYTYMFPEMSWGRLSATAQGTLRQASSNMLYELTYRYNYDSAYYFAGVSWEFAK